MKDCLVTVEMLENLSAMDILVYAYLCTATDGGEVTTCIKWITQEIGYTPKSGAGKSLDKVRLALENLKQQNLINFCVLSEGKIKNNTPLLIKIRNVTQVNTENNGIILSKSDVEIIRDTAYACKDKLMAVLLLMRARKLIKKSARELINSLCTRLPDATFKEIRDLLRENLLF